VSSNGRPLTSGKLTVFFQAPFWVGVFERLDKDGLAVSRVVFGAEPSDAQVLEFVLANYRKLSFSAPVAVEGKELGAEQRMNPKRRQREAQRLIEQNGVSSKAQEAMRLDLEQRKKTRQTESKGEREAEERRLYERKRELKKKKKSGH
jgi:hypothetical protein